MSLDYMAWTPKTPAQDRAQVNRRGYVRYQCPLATPGRLQLQSEEWLRAWIIDLCLSGAGLLLNRQLETGMHIIVHLVNSIEKKVHEIPAQVRHATCQADGDWFVGCEFTRLLTDDELDALLA